jgi:hypothetical protein
VKLGYDVRLETAPLAAVVCWDLAVNWVDVVVQAQRHMSFAIPVLFSSVSSFYSILFVWI